MNYLRVCILLFVMAFIGLNAGGVPDVIEKDSSAQKELKLTVAHKDNPRNQKKVTITVSFKGNKFTKVSLFSGGKNTKLATKVKNGMVSISFDIEKTDLEKSSLYLTGSDPNAKVASFCETSGSFVYLKGYVDE